MTASTIPPLSVWPCNIYIYIYIYIYIIVENAAGQTEDSTAATPARRVAGGLCPFIIPAGTRDTLTQTRTHGFGLVAICRLQR
jgi:hypothetical protein